MPVPKRYFHCSQEINSDPELWAFTAEFGDRSLRTWLQILSILDRSANQWRVSGDWLGTLSRMVRQSVANVSRQIRWLTENEWLLVRETAADGSPLVFEARNWTKYNRSQEQKGSRTNPDSGTRRGLVGTPSFPTPAPTPSLSFPTPKKKKEEEEEIKSSPRELISVVPTERPPKSARSWDAYATAYLARYHAEPVRNAQVNSLLCKLVDKLGEEKAPAVAAFYVQHNNPFYVGKRHPVNLLLADAEGLHTQWVTGVKATTGEARNAEQKDNVSEQYKRVMASMEVKHG